MKRSLTYLLKNGKIQLLLLSIFGGILLKIFGGALQYAPLLFLGEVLQFFIVVFFIVNLSPYIRKLSKNPIALLTGFLIAAIGIQFVLQVIEPLYGLTRLGESGTAFSVVVTTLTHLVLVFSSAYLFGSLRELFFLKQRRKVDVQFNSLVFFLGVAGISAFVKSYKGFEFIHFTFYAVTILLIIYNCAKISWIAFLSKKEKRNVILLTIALIFIVIWNIILLNDEFIEKLIMGYSPGIESFLFLIHIYGLVYAGVLFFTALFHLPTAEAIDRKNQELESLQYISRLLNQVFDPKELASTVTELAVSVCASDAAWIVLKKGNENSVISPRNIDIRDCESVNNLVLELYSASGTEIRFIDLKENISQRTNGIPYTFAAVVPLRRHNALSGFLITTKTGAVPFDEDDRSTLETFAYYVALAFENSRLFEESLERERLANELEVAREMQQKLIPASVPDYANLEISAAFIPAFEVGGDYYDFFEMADGRLGFIVADVAGKGISAAFIMAELKGIFETLSGLLASPREILLRANTLIRRSLDKNQFITAISGIADPLTGEVILSRAGHPPALHISGNQISEIQPAGYGLGLTASAQLAGTLVEQKIILRKDDTLFLFTDGITEAMDEHMKDFGLIQIREILARESGKSVKEIQQVILHALVKHAEGHIQHDDITLLILRWNKN